MAWRGSLTRSLRSAARVSISRSSQPLSGAGRLRPPRAATQRFSFSNHRYLNKLWWISTYGVQKVLKLVNRWILQGTFPLEESRKNQ